MFKFRLEPLISIRDDVLKNRQAELAKVLYARRILEDDLQAVEQKLADGISTARGLMQAGQTVNVEYLLGLRRQEMFLLADKDKLVSMIEEVEKEVEKWRAAVVAANKELKIVEKLKEKRYEKYLGEENKQDAKMMDEIAERRVR